MDIDAHNAQLNEVNDAKIQQIKAQRKLFGGIIKKGDPLYKNIINVILFAFLFPCMIIFASAIGLKDLSIYVWESLISFIDSTVQAFRRTKQYIIVNYYFVQNRIYNKAQLLIGKLSYSIKVCSEYITSQLQHAKLLIIYYSLLFIENYLIIFYQWISKKFKVLIGIFQFWFQRLSSQIKIQFLKLMRFLIAQCKFILLKVKQIILILYRVIKRITIYLEEKIIQLLTFLQNKIKKLSILFYQHILTPLKNQIVFYSCYLFIKVCQGMIKFQKAMIYYVPLILNYLKTKYLQFQDWIYVQIKLIGRCIKYLKNRSIHYSLLLIDYILGKYQQLKQNVISPLSLKIKEISKKIKNLIIDMALKTIDFIKSALVFFRDKVINKLKIKFINYYQKGSNRRGKMLTSKLKQIYIELRLNSIKRYEKYLQMKLKLQEKIIIMAQNVSQKITMIRIKINYIAKYCISKIKIACQFIKKQIKFVGKSIKSFVIFVLRSIKKFIKWTIEIQCKIIVKFIITFRILIPIISLIEKCFDILFIILSQPYILFNKIVDSSIDIFAYKMPDKLYDVCVYLIEKLISLFYKIERLIEIIIKQAKKVSAIINSKIIQPIVRFFIYCYNIIKKVILTIYQSLKNFKDMIKYNYVLPAWASIRLFGVKVKNSYIKMKQKVILIINYGIHQLYLAYQFLKNKILLVKNYITHLFKLLMQFIKRLILFLWQQIKYVYGVMIDPMIQFKNYMIQVFITFKQMITQFIQLLKSILVAQCMMVKEVIFSILNKIKQLLDQIKLSLIEQLQAIKLILENLYDSIRHSMIYMKNQIFQIMEQIQQSLIQQMNAIADLFKTVGQTIKMQGVQIKESIITLKNDMILSIKTIFKRN